MANDTVLAGGSGESTSAPTPATQQITAPSSGSAPSILLLTGPNYSGKSVLLKQVALIVFMAHVGRQVVRCIAVLMAYPAVLFRPMLL